MSLFKKSKLEEMSFQDIDPAIANTMAVGSSITNVSTGTGSLSTTIKTAYDQYVTVSSGSGSTATFSTPKEPTGISEEERLERLQEMSSSIENLIADFIPEADKDIPTQIAKAVVEEIFSSGHVLPLLADAKGYKETESKLLQNFQNMTMQEYAKIRPKLMKGITK